MTTGDFNAFMKLFKDYFYHINNYQDSLLARIYGIYQITMGNQRPVYLVMMGNTQQVQGNEYIKYCFDLKGSMVQREVKEKVKNTYCLKDKNVLALKEKENFLMFKKDDIGTILKQMALDISLMNQFSLMDYSLLLCVEYHPGYVEKNQQNFKKHEIYNNWVEIDTSQKKQEDK